MIFHNYWVFSRKLWTTLPGNRCNITKLPRRQLVFPAKSDYMLVMTYLKGGIGLLFRRCYKQYESKINIRIKVEHFYFKFSELCVSYYEDQINIEEIIELCNTTRKPGLRDIIKAGWQHAECIVPEQEDQGDSY